MKNSIKMGFLEGFKFLIKPKGFLILFLYFILALLLVVSVLGIPLINVCRYNFTKKYLEAKKLETGFFFENLNSIDRYYTCFISKTFMLAKCIMKEFIILLLVVICFGIGTGIVYICYQKYGPSNGYIIVPMIFCFPFCFSFLVYFLFCISKQESLNYIIANKYDLKGIEINKLLETAKIDSIKNFILYLLKLISLFCVIGESGFGLYYLITAFKSGIITTSLLILFIILIVIAFVFIFSFLFMSFNFAIYLFNDSYCQINKFKVVNKPNVCKNIFDNYSLKKEFSNDKFGKEESLNE